MLELSNSSPPLPAASAEASTVSSSGNQIPSQPPQKKKRNQPGMPDPEAEVLALSPKTLLATNRFVCEICGKGFQRDQNLQLHRRGHNLPWNLKQRGTKEVRKRVYVCPETSCIHHDPKRALGDLTGIKKHFCRKHGEKKWKCERCAKKYAVQSDWKAHMKICGTKEYKCDCGTVFSRRDSFVTHRAFCDALAQESVRVQVTSQSFDGVAAGREQRNGNSNGSGSAGSPPTVDAATATAPSSSIPSPVLSIQSSEAAENLNTATAPPLTAGGISTAPTASDGNVVFGSIFAPLSSLRQQETQQASNYSNLISSMSGSETLGFTLEPTSLSLSSLYQLSQNTNRQFTQPPSMTQPIMSATALLQKAAEMGPTASASSLLSGFALTTSAGEAPKNENSIGLGIGPGLPLDMTGPMMGGPSGLFVGRPTTLDLLGLGIGPTGGSSNGLSAFLTPFSDGLGLGSFGGGKPWEGPTERKPN